MVWTDGLTAFGLLLVACVVGVVATDDELICGPFTNCCIQSYLVVASKLSVRWSFNACGHKDSRRSAKESSVGILAKHFCVLFIQEQAATQAATGDSTLTMGSVSFP